MSVIVAARRICEALPSRNRHGDLPYLFVDSAQRPLASSAPGGVDTSAQSVMSAQRLEGFD
jgi:hypothetical protein